MNLEQELRTVFVSESERRAAPPVDLAGMMTRGKIRRRRRTTLRAGVAAAVVAVIGFGAFALVDGRNTSAPQPASNPASSAPNSLPSTAITTTSSSSYTSSRYNLTLGYPLGWTPEPASRDWSWETDARDWRSRAHDAFMDPGQHVRVSVWSAPLDPNTREESITYLVAWVEDYCKKTGNSPCTGIAHRAVELCLEKRDCHPGLLVPFKEDVQAFFSGGIYDQDAMTVVAVWRPESAPSVAPYGGAQRLLESFLSTMDVWPSRPAPSRP